ncbi:hypothetical protein [Schleiferilactobacillus shenzhenensis]|nr:hypothetical protein [Schleiferilactobacillus shenzhenensis]
MWANYFRFRKDHPYLIVVLDAIGLSLIGITVEYLWHRDVIADAFWFVLFLTITSLLEVRHAHRKS